MQRFGHTIVVTVEDLIRSDDGEPVMTMNNYRNLVRRKQLNILRPGKGPLCRDYHQQQQTTKMARWRRKSRILVRR